MWHTLDGTAPQVGDRDGPEDSTHDQGASTNEDAVDPLCRRERFGAEDSASKLNNQSLNNNNKGQNCQEDPVAEEATEHIPLAGTHFARVDFIEYLISRHE